MRWFRAASAVLGNQLCGVFGEVGQNEIRARAANARKRFKNGPVEIEPAVLSGSHNHAELAAYLVGAQRNLETLTSGVNNIQARQSRFHHDHIRAFLDVELDFT